VVLKVFLTDPNVACRGNNLPAAGSGVQFISTHFNGGFGLTGNGTFVTFGCGNADSNHFGNGVHAPTGETGIQTVFGGRWFSTAIDSQGRVVAWGQNSFNAVTNLPGGATGAGCVTSTPTSGYTGPCYSVETGFKGVAGTEDHILALKTNGQIVGWGENEFSLLSGLPGGQTNSGGIYRSVSVGFDVIGTMATNGVALRFP
jgi:alpha-tubulin suppressor-like RCC1 family protein